MTKVDHEPLIIFLIEKHKIVSNATQTKPVAAVVYFREPTCQPCESVDAACVVLLGIPCYVRIAFGDLEAARLLAGNGEGRAVAQEHLGGEEEEGQGTAAVSVAATRRRHAAAGRRREQPREKKRWSFRRPALAPAQQGKVNSNAVPSPLLLARELDQSEHAVVVAVATAAVADAAVMAAAEAAAAMVCLTVTAAEDNDLSVTSYQRLPRTQTMEEIGRWCRSTRWRGGWAWARASACTSTAKPRAPPDGWEAGADRPTRSKDSMDLEPLTLTHLMGQKWSPFRLFFGPVRRTFGPNRTIPIFTFSS